MLVAMRKGKQPKLSAAQIRRLIAPMGGCIASDRITIDGARVGLMVRERPEREDDSGWVFLAGDEPQEYLNDVDNLAVYEVNTIVNYDPGIIPYLYALPGQRFQWDAKVGGYLESEDSEPDASSERMPEGMSVVQGRHGLGAGWSLWLRTPFRRRTEARSLVLWRPALTLWISVVDSKGSSRTSTVDEVKGLMSPSAFDVRSVDRQGLSCISYRVKGDSTETPAPSLNAFVVGDHGYVQLGIYFDREQELDAARELVDSVVCLRQL
jgi:hypothetical protein